LLIVNYYYFYASGPFRLASLRVLPVRPPVCPCVCLSVPYGNRRASF